jgi:hypothetical protein
VDDEARMGELVVTDHDDEFGDVRHVPTTDAPGWAPRTLKELRAWVERIATTIRKHYNV